MKSKSTIKRHLKQLRHVIDTSNDPVEKRVAYHIETAVRWATEDTVGWRGLVDEARTCVEYLREEWPVKVSKR